MAVGEWPAYITTGKCCTSIAIAIRYDNIIENYVASYVHIYPWQSHLYELIGGKGVHITEQYVRLNTAI